MEGQTPIKIDIEKIIRSKTKKKIPKFIFRLVEKIIHQQEINTFFENNIGIEGLDFVNAALNYLNVQIVIKGEENIPAEGEFIFASNHPLGGLDGLAMSSIIGKHFDGKIKFLVNNFLMHLTPLAPLFVPINVGGRIQDRNLNSNIKNIFESKQQFLIFPAGICSRKINGKIQDLTWKKTFISKAKESGRSIIPVYFEAQNSRFFYNLARIRKALGIKLNIEMMFLPHEMFKQKGKTFTVTFGKPISHEVFDDTKTQLQWAQYVRECVYKMKNF
ncbi:MAG: 1-acyl-sn-glycerol-3-phosphate acyltransferase [Paludibacteraceae bacterium]|jgi:putative hemolysin|nr:1-acyl-sn-glycerol-3-phosphate acyltransferase [Paludibacteraceae bacterium]MBO7724740.1 1-acyl-sn-glycerol-3-phosphate acyltransferase [Paludibacteraceae bacterium]